MVHQYHVFAIEYHGYKTSALQSPKIGSTVTKRLIYAYNYKASQSFDH